MPGDLICECDLFISQLEVTISTFKGAMLPCQKGHKFAELPGGCVLFVLSFDAFTSYLLISWLFGFAYVIQRSNIHYTPEDEHRT